MAWNRPDERPKVRVSGAKKSRPLTYGILAGIVFVASVIAWLFIHNGKENRQEKAIKPERQTIPEIKPALVHTNTMPVPKIQVEYRNAGNGKVMKYVNGQQAWMYPRDDYHGPVMTTGVHRVQSLAERTFKYNSDLEIAAILLARPGSMAIGNPDYDRWFTKDFLKSYDNPALPMPGDSDEQKELKRAVAEVKGDLRARYEAGEDLAKIMNDARKELRELGAYKEELEEQVRQISKDPAQSEKDIEDCIAAANKMLEERGLPPLRQKGFFKHQMNLRKKDINQ